MYRKHIGENIGKIYKNLYVACLFAICCYFLLYFLMFVQGRLWGGFGDMLRCVGRALGGLGVHLRQFGGYVGRLRDMWRPRTCSKLDQLKMLFCVLKCVKT